MDQAGQDNGQRSLQDGRDAPEVASALDERQRAPRDARDEREEAQMPERPAQPELVSNDQPRNPTSDQQQGSVQTVDDGQVREVSGVPRDGNDSRQAADRSSDAQETAERTADDGERADEARENRRNDRRDRGASTKARPAKTSSATTSSATTRCDDDQGRDNQGRDWDEEGGGRRSRRRRGRDRQNQRNRGGGGNMERYDEPVISEDDVLVSARGIWTSLTITPSSGPTATCRGPTTRTSHFRWSRSSACVRETWSPV